MIARRPMFEPEWITGHVDLIVRALMQHLVLTGIAVGTGLVVALILSVLVLRFRRLYAPVIGLTGLMYTIPSLALFALLVPFTGLTSLTAEIALVSYTLLILVRNIVTGIDSVPSHVVEAARAMGFRPTRLLLGVQLPIAMPVVIAGVRIAAVTVVGLVTVTALIGLGGLGMLILNGIRRGIIFPTPVWVGTILSALLAAAIDLTLLGLQRLLTPWAKARRT